MPSCGQFHFTCVAIDQAWLFSFLSRYSPLGCRRGLYKFIGLSALVESTCYMSFISSASPFICLCEYHRVIYIELYVNHGPGTDPAVTFNLPLRA